MIRLTVRDKDIVQTLRVDSDKAFIGRSPSNTVVLGDAAAKNLAGHRTGQGDDTHGGHGGD